DRTHPRYRKGGGLAGFGRIGLRHRGHPVRRWRDDLVSRFRGRRLTIAYDDFYRTYAFRPFSLREKVGMRGSKRKFLHFISLTPTLSGNRKHFCVSPVLMR